MNKKYKTPTKEFSRFVSSTLYIVFWTSAFLYNESVIFTNILSRRYALTKCLGYVPTLDSKKVVVLLCQWTHLQNKENNQVQSKTWIPTNNYLDFQLITQWKSVIQIDFLKLFQISLYFIFSHLTPWFVLWRCEILSIPQQLYFHVIQIWPIVASEVFYLSWHGCEYLNLVKLTCEILKKTVSWRNTFTFLALT